MKTDHKVACVRWAGFFLVGLWGWYFAASFRTSDWGYDRPLGELLNSLRTVVIFALPLALLPLLGMPWRHKLVASVIFTVVCVLSVELFARAQEHLLVRHFRNTGEGRVERRWWPFEHHDLGFIEGKGWGCD